MHLRMHRFKYSNNLSFVLLFLNQVSIIGLEKIRVKIMKIQKKILMSPRESKT